jgi:hypothetical protein
MKTPFMVRIPLPQMISLHKVNDEEKFLGEISYELNFLSYEA